MKKKFLYLVVLTALSNVCLAQAYRVTTIEGTVLYNNKPLKPNDLVSDNTKITSNGKSARVGLFSLQKGKLKLSFTNAKLVAASAPGHSELYELTVGNYLQKYTASTLAATKGADDYFDLQVFFNDTAETHPINKILLVEGQTLPLRSNLMKLMPSDKYFICKSQGRDTLCDPIARGQGPLLLFDGNAFKGLISTSADTVPIVHCMIKIGYTDNSVYQEQYFPDPIDITVITQSELHAIVDSYKTGLTSYYNNDKDKLAADIEDDLTDHYGRFYKPEVRRLILNFLK